MRGTTRYWRTPGGVVGLAVATAWVAATAAAAPQTPPFPAGVQSKTAGVESGLVSTDAPSVLYNPANLRADRGVTPYAELGLVTASLSYEQPEFDPVVVTVTAPLATLGVTMPLRRPLDRLTLGVVVFPSANGRQHVPGLPRKLGGTLQAVVVDTADLAVDAGLGAAYQLPQGIGLGLAVVHTVEFHTLKAGVPGNPQDLAAMSYHNQFDRLVLGARYDWRDAATATLAVRPAQARPYKGTQTLSASAEGTTPPRVTSFVPTTVAVGAMGRGGRLSLGLELIRQLWAKGRGVVKDGLSVDRPPAALNDITQTSVTAGFAVPRGPLLTAGVADLPSPWGDGRDDGVVADHVHGADFGGVDAVHRRSYAVNAAWRAYGAALAFGLARTAGTRDVGPGGENIGYYSVALTTVTLALARPL